MKPYRVTLLIRATALNREWINRAMVACLKDGLTAAQRLHIIQNGGYDADDILARLFQNRIVIGGIQFTYRTFSVTQEQWDRVQSRLQDLPTSSRYFKREFTAIEDHPDGGEYRLTESNYTGAELGINDGEVLYITQIIEAGAI